MKWRVKNKLDKQFSASIKERDKRTCQFCGRKEGRMNTSHIIPKSCISLRWSPENAITLCFRCHRGIWHLSPVEGVRLLEKIKSRSEIESLLEKANNEKEIVKELRKK